jgi:Protein of unknown function, DUF481
VRPRAVAGARRPPRRRRDPVPERRPAHGQDRQGGGRQADDLDWKPHKLLTLFHNLEWLPAFYAPLADYNLNTDAGLRATIIGDFFAELKIEFRYDSTPADGKKSEDLRFLVGVGWSF